MDFTRCGGPDEKILPAPGTNQILGFVECRLSSPAEKKIKLQLSLYEATSYTTYKWPHHIK